MPLSVRLDADIKDGTAALEWLATCLTLATDLFNARVTWERTDQGVEVTLIFVGPEAGDSFLALVNPMRVAPLGDREFVVSPL